MSRSFRVYQKKRGNRRTGSRALGSLGELVFFGLFFLVGCWMLVRTVATTIIPEWQVNHEFVETTCVVRGKEIGRSDGGEAYRPEIQIEYEISGNKYVTTTYDITGTYSSGQEDKQAIIDQFDVGGKYPCWYDPSDNKEAVLVRGYSLFSWLMLALPVTFLLIGGGGVTYRLLHCGKSAERRAAGNLATDLFDRRGRAAGEFPNVPAGTDMTNSPGTRLKFRLPIGTSDTWKLVSIGIFCLIWNGVVLGLCMGFSVFQGPFNPGPSGWITLIVLALFALVGIFIIGYFFRQLLITTGVGQTFVEISGHPLFPGEQYDLLVSQAGRLRIKSLSILLICEEAATYRQGTNTRTETRRAFQRELFHRENFDLHRGLPLEEKCEMEIPAGIMHSFKSENNEVNWKIVVVGKVNRWPDYERSFPVIVYPRGQRTEGRGQRAEDQHERAADNNRFRRK